jgi:hypothetical protein
VVIANQGPTRGDGYAAFTVDAPLGRLLPALADRTTGSTPAGGGAGGAVPVTAQPVAL